MNVVSFNSNKANGVRSPYHHDAVVRLPGPELLPELCGQAPLQSKQEAQEGTSFYQFLRPRLPFEPWKQEAK